jgi:hypothetical protein
MPARWVEHKLRGTTTRALDLLAVCIAVFALGGCGKSHGSKTAVTVGSHAITATQVEHWMTVLWNKGYGAHDKIPPIPKPPDYKACITLQRIRSPSALPPKTIVGPKAFCDFEYRRFRLKALYLLISHQWVAGEASELGVHVNANELRQRLVAYERAMAPSSAGARQLLHNWKVTTSELRLSFELAQLSERIETKVQAEAGSAPSARERALASFGREFKRKWVDRTRCSQPYVVPICRDYVAPKTPPDLVPPSVPLTHLPAGA